MSGCLLLLPLVGASLWSTSAFVVKTSSLTFHQRSSQLMLRSKSVCSNVRPKRRVRQDQDERQQRSARTLLMAKKKKGPAADALAALEALEVEETVTSSLDEEYSRPTKKAKKKGPKGPAAAALAALEELEAGVDELQRSHESLVSEGQSGADEAIVASQPSGQEFPASTDAERSLPQSKKPGKKRKGAKGPAAGALAALQELEVEEMQRDRESLVAEELAGANAAMVASQPSANEFPATTDPERSPLQSKKSGKKKKGAKGPAAGALAALEKLEAGEMSSSEAPSSSRAGKLDHADMAITDPVVPEDASRWVNAVKEDKVDSGDDVELENEESQGHAPREKEVAEDALRKAGMEISAAQASLVDEDQWRQDEAVVVKNIRELAQKKALGLINEEEFMAKKRQVLEMEQLRRDVVEETRMREEGEIEDAGAGILTSVGQNTPPPSSKESSESGKDEEREPPCLSKPSPKDQRRTYKTSDLDKYSIINSSEPRVFGPVPDSVKESLAARDSVAKQRGALALDALAEGDASNIQKPEMNLADSRFNVDVVSTVDGTLAGPDIVGGAKRQGGQSSDLEINDDGIHGRSCCIIM